MTIDIAAINALLPDNTNREISPKDVRDCFAKVKADTDSDSQKRVLVVDTAQNLRDLPVSVGNIPNAVETLGALAAGDGGGGAWYWDTTSADNDNLGTVLLPTGHAGAGRWVRLEQFRLTPEMFGAVGDGVTDDLAALEAMQGTDAAELFYPSVYGVSAPLRLALGKLHHGGAPNESDPRSGIIALAGFPTTSNVEGHTIPSPVAWSGTVSGSGSINIRDMAFDGGGVAQDGLLLVRTASARLDNVWTNDVLNDGLVIDACQNALYSKCTTLRSGRYGLRVLNFARNSTFTNFNCRFVGTANVYFGKDTAYPGSGTIGPEDRPQEISMLGGVWETPITPTSKRANVLHLDRARYCMFICMEFVNSTYKDVTDAMVRCGTDAGANTFFGCIFNAQGATVPALIDDAFENVYNDCKAITFGTTSTPAPVIFQASSRAIFRDINFAANYATKILDYTGAGQTQCVWHPRIAQGLYSAAPTAGTIDAPFTYFAYDLSALLVYDAVYGVYRPSQMGGERSKPNGATTMDVTGLSVINSNDSAATVLTNLTGGASGQELRLRFINANTTISHAAGGDGQIFTKDSLNIVSSSGLVVTLLKSGSAWYEAGRSK